MDGLADLFKQIGNIDSTVKLIAFLASILLLTVSAILKYSDKISKQAANILLFLFGAVLVIACLAMIFGRPVARTTLTLTVTNDAKIPYRSDQIDLNVHSTMASITHSAQANSWAVVFDPDELPKDRAISIFAQTKDTSSFADTLYRLKDEAFQTLELRLQRRSNSPGPTSGRPDSTFWMNLSDETLRQAIAKLTGLTYDPNSRKNKIVVTYESSNIRSFHPDGPYSFVRSAPVVLVDRRRYTLSNCSIPEMQPNSTYDKELMKNYAQTKSMDLATAYFRKNPEVLARWIKPQ
jgi:hypothetical protein